MEMNRWREERWRERKKERRVHPDVATEGKAGRE